ncbi:hypothetical protein ACFRFL_42600 [Streptomyces sp. NPDC056708]|uniref:hypothetical protein n=1 Tax=unclassified Streptomyces TaxID=2593676 RepID=UPI0036AB715B
MDVLGLVMDCVVLPASAHENTAGIALLDGVAGQCGTVTEALVDQGFKKSVVDHGKTWASTWRSSSATRPRRASFRRPSGGSWSRRTGS